MGETEQVKIRKIAAAKTMRKLMADHFYELDRAVKTGHPKVAWCTSVGPAELLRAMGFVVYFPENHGAMLGENGLWQKQSFQSTVTRSPYLISWPGTLPEGEVRTDLAELLDTGPTLLGLCGVDRPEGMRGRDLFGDAPEPEAIYGIIGYGNEDSITYPLAKSGEVWPRRANIRTKAHRLGVSVRFKGQPLTRADRQPDLIDLKEDPDERSNVYTDPAHRETRDRLEALLDKWLEMSIEVDLAK